MFILNLSRLGMYALIYKSCVLGMNADQQRMSRRNLCSMLFICSLQQNNLKSYIPSTSSLHPEFFYHTCCFLLSHIFGEGHWLQNSLWTFLDGRLSKESLTDEISLFIFNIFHIFHSSPLYWNLPPRLSLFLFCARSNK